MDIRYILNLLDSKMPPAATACESRDNLLKELHEHALLIEGRSEQYKQMLTPLLQLPDVGPLPNDRTVTAILNNSLTLKRDDRIVWAIKWQRSYYAQKWLTNNPEATPQQIALVKKLSMPSSDGVMLQRLIKLFGSHYLAIPYSAIQDYVFDANSPPEKIERDLEQLERKFKESTRGFVTQQEGDEIILTFPDGMCWMKLSRGGCGEEAKAMGHCGNGAGYRGQNILSLRKERRKIDGVKYYEPFLTFIRDPDGYLGEMKGKNNDKPIPTYHPYIVALLKLPLIAGLRGGGYLPQNNFMFSDLSEAQQDDLLAVKPELGGFAYMLKKEGLTEEVKKQFASESESKFEGMLVLVSETEINWQVADNWGDLVDTYGSNTLQYYKQYALDGDHMDIDVNVTDEYKERVIDELPLYALPALYKRIDEIAAEHGPKEEEDRDEDDDFDDDDDIEWDRKHDPSEIIKIANVYDSDLDSALDAAVYAGYEQGWENEMYKAFRSAIQDPDLLYGRIVLGMADDPVVVKLTPQGYSDLLAKYDDEYGEAISLKDNLSNEIIGMSDSSYGFDGYSQESASERLIEECLDVPPVPYFEIGDRATIVKALDFLNREAKRLGGQSRPITGDESDSQIKRQMEQQFEKVYGYEWSDDSNEARASQPQFYSKAE